MTHTLTGKNEINVLNLKGAMSVQKNPIYFQIKQIKDKILENYLIPLFTKQWEILNENSFFIDNLQRKISHYYKIYHYDELIAYHELMRVIKLLLENYKTLNLYEKQNTYQTTTSKQITSMIFKTSKIVLLPEYEIYDSIIGKPKKELNEMYEENIINIIKSLLEKDNCTYKKIKTAIDDFMK